MGKEGLALRSLEASRYLTLSWRAWSPRQPGTLLEQGGSEADAASWGQGSCIRPGRGNK